MSVDEVVERLLRLDAKIARRVARLRDNLNGKWYGLGESASRPG